MKRNFGSLLGILILMLVLTALFPIPALAAPVISSVSPDQVVNDIDNVITITGTGFEDGSVVSIGVITNTVSSSIQPSGNLKATIPLGFAAGVYDVTVTNADATSSTLPSALTVSEPTPTPNPYSRPQVVIDTYSLSVDSVRYGQDFTLSMSLDNAGGSTAYGLQVTFISADLLMLKNGGVVVAGNLGVVGKANFSQTMTAAASLVGVSRVSVEMDVSYYDDKGAPYTDKFMLTFPAASSGGGGSYVPAATATPTGVSRSQLVVKTYQTDVDPLQPGVQFTLGMSVQNMGNIPARNITMIIGGGSSGSGSGTPQAGISGGSGEFTNFAPVGSSNIQSLGDLQPGATLTATQKLVVNVSTSPGAYPMKVTFSYQDAQGNPVNDEQVITLLVYDLPNVDVSFYQPIGMLMSGQPNPLPLQVVSLGKRNVVLGRMVVSSNAGSVENGEALVGSLDPGGYFTLDAMLTPDGPGPLDLNITIEYTDDFNQVRTITKTLSVVVIDIPVEPTPDLSAGGGGTQVDGSSSPESIWAKVWRFLLGLFGLDSGSSSAGTGNGAPTETPLPVPFPQGGKG